MRGVSILIAGVTVAFVTVATLAVGAQAPAANAKTMKNPVPPSAASVTAGAATFKKYCSFCHGDAAKGDGRLAPKGTTPANLTNVDALTPPWWSYGPPSATKPNADRA